LPVYKKLAKTGITGFAHLQNYIENGQKPLSPFGIKSRLSSLNQRKKAFLEEFPSSLGAKKG
jgi:hypothetical protein